ncbi:MAG TPA: hypothetical protein VHA75_20815 [Rugosimonospora sp.]|nr:hypothetical protein [Rugosimonospora sp.]
MSQPMEPTDNDLPDDEYEQILMDLCADLPGDELRELATLAEAMHADGGQ